MKTAILLVAAIIAIGWTLSLKPDSAFTEPTPSVTVDQIVSQLQTVEELIILKVAVSGIVSGAQPGARFWQGESRMVLLVRGHATYGVDLSSVDVAINGDTVTITLPEPRICDHWVDVDRTEIWERHTGRFRRDEGLNLESACWTSAKAIIFEAAAHERHRVLARTHAERTINTLLRGAVPRISVRVLWGSEAGTQILTFRGPAA